MRRTAMVEIDEHDLVPPWIRKKMPIPNMVSKMARELSKMTLKEYIKRVIQLVHYWPALVQEIIYEQETKRLREISNCCGRTSRGCRKVKSSTSRLRRRRQGKLRKQERGHVGRGLRQATGAAVALAVGHVPLILMRLCDAVVRITHVENHPRPPSPLTSSSPLSPHAQPFILLTF